MLGNLEPEENVMNDLIKDKDEYFAWEEGGIMDQIQNYIKTLGWNSEDDIRVKIGGVANSGIHQTEGANPKWAKPFGTVSYQNDAFIVIENATRNPVIPSQPNPDLKAHHSE